MRWMVVVKFKDGTTATEIVHALNKSDANYRAAVACEVKYNKIVERVLRTLKN